VAEALSSPQSLDIITSPFNSCDLLSTVQNHFSNYSLLPTHFDSLLKVLFLTNIPVLLNYKQLEED